MLLLENTMTKIFDKTFSFRPRKLQTYSTQYDEGLTV